MSLVAHGIRTVEKLPLPDAVTRLGVDFLVGMRRQSLAEPDRAVNRAFAKAMDAYPIAEHTDSANAQHYEVPAEFFARFLGPHRKYSCCLYPEPATTLAEAEALALAETVEHAQLADGQEILELGCGWGSLSLYMAARFPGAHILAVSNSNSQREYIEAQAASRGLRNLKIVTADVNHFTPDAKFDRVVSVEMFEHVANWRALLSRVRSWMLRDGKLFIHVFSHRTDPYRFDHTDPTDWIAQHFFTGGIMPSHDLIREFDDIFALEQDWRWNGAHYQRTALDWLAQFDAARAEILPVLQGVYGRDAMLWLRRWRLFFLATAGLFGHRGGEEWGVSHYLLAPK